LSSWWKYDNKPVWNAGRINWIVVVVIIITLSLSLICSIQSILILKRASLEAGNEKKS